MICSFDLISCGLFSDADSDSDYAGSNIMLCAKLNRFKNIVKHHKCHLSPKFINVH